MKKLMLSWILILLILSLAACGSGPAGNAEGLGGITATAVWPGSGTAAKAGVVYEKAPAEVAWVRMIVSKGTTTLSADFNALVVNSGSISGVPAGTGWTLTFVGLNAAKTIVYYEGSRSGITVTSGQTTNAGSIALRLMPGLAGMLDTTFDVDGMVITTIGANSSYASSIVQQADGKLVVAGRSGAPSQFTVLRYDPEGSLDPTFSGDGLATYGTGSDGYAEAMTIQSDGKIVVVGRASNFSGNDTVLVRILPDGTLDTGFGSSGLVTRNVATQDGAYAVGLQSAGTIVVAGYVGAASQDFSLLRFNTSGGIISTTTTSIGTSIDIGYAIAVAADDSIYVAGDSYNGTNYDFALVKYDASGNFVSKTTTPIGNGNDMARAIAIQPDGKILVGGSTACASGTCLGLVRYSSIGVLDASFGTGGKVSTSFFNYPMYSAETIRVQPDGKIIVAGLVDNGTRMIFGVFRFNPDGSPDATFDQTGAAGSAFASIGAGVDINSLLSHRGLLIQADGKIVSAANARATAGGLEGFALARFWNDVTTTKRVYTGNYSSTVSVVSTATQTQAADTALISSPSFPPPGGSMDLGHVAVDPRANRLYVSNTGGIGTRLFVIDTINSTVISQITFTTGDRGPGRIVLDTAGNRAYVSLYGLNSGSGGDGNKVAVIDTSDNTVKTLITVGFGPRGLALDTAANRLYSVSSVDRKVYVIDTTTNTVIGTIPSAGTFGTDLGAAAIDVAKRKLYVTNQNSAGTPGQHLLFVIDLTTNTVTKSLTTGDYPLAVVVDEAESRAYVSNMGSNSVTFINTTSDTVVAGGPNNILVGASPRSIGLDTSNPLMHMLYVANYSDNTLSVIDVTNVVPLNPIPVGIGPTGIAIAP